MKKCSGFGPGLFWRACGILFLCLAVQGILPATGQGPKGLAGSDEGQNFRAEDFSFEPNSIILNPGGEEGIIIVDSGSVAFQFDKDSQTGIIIVDSGKRTRLSIKIIRGDNLVSADEISIRVIPPERDIRDGGLEPKPGTFKIGLKAASGAEASADYQLRFDIGRETIPILRKAFELQIGKGDLPPLYLSR